MDYTKTIPFDDYLKYKNAKLDIIFPAKVEIYQFANYWLSMNSDIQVKNCIGVEDYQLVFMDELLPTRPYLGYATMGVNFLSDVKFDAPYLYFTTSDGKKVRLS